MEKHEECINTYELAEMKETVKSQGEDIISLDKRTSNLELSDARIEVQIEHMVLSIKGLVDTLKTTYIVVLGGLGGFLIWYVQSLSK